MKAACFKVAALVVICVAVATWEARPTQLPSDASIAGVNVGGCKSVAEIESRLAMLKTRPIELYVGGVAHPKTPTKLGIDLNLQLSAAKLYVSLTRHLWSPFVEPHEQDLVIKVADSYRWSRLQDALNRTSHRVQFTPEGCIRSAPVGMADFNRICTAMMEGKQALVLSPSQPVSDLRLLFTIEQSFPHRSAGSLHNIRQSMKYLNGTFLPAGTEFSYDRTVGPRTAKRHFVNGSAIVDGQVSGEVIGGGACGPAGMFFQAAMRSGAQITKRFNHSHKPALPGFDAAIWQGSKDLRFIAPTDMAFETGMKGKTAWVRVWGNFTPQSIWVKTASAPNALIARTYRMGLNGPELLFTSKYPTKS